jgi:hypothetical protein
MNMSEPIHAARSEVRVASPPDDGVAGRLRIKPQTVLDNLARLEAATWRRRRLRITAETGLLAGVLDVLPAADRPREELMSTATLMLGDEYSAGFRDGFNCSPASRRSTRRYVEGLDDGNLVGKAVRRAAPKAEL